MNDRSEDDKSALASLITSQIQQEIVEGEISLEPFSGKKKQSLPSLSLSFHSGQISSNSSDRTQKSNIRIRTTKLIKTWNNNRFW